MSEIAEDQRPAEMGLAVVGAAGRMGQTLIRTICAMDGVRLVGAIERARKRGVTAGTVIRRRVDQHLEDEPWPILVARELG